MKTFFQTMIYQLQKRISNFRLKRLQRLLYRPPEAPLLYIQMGDKRVLISVHPDDTNPLIIHLCEAYSRFYPPSEANLISRTGVSSLLNYRIEYDKATGMRVAHMEIHSSVIDTLRLD